MKDRSVVQWAIAYLAGAWLVLQVLDVVEGAWSLPRSVLRGVQVFLAAGFLIALLLAWYHGERGRQRVSGPELLMISALFAIAAGVTGLVADRGAGDESGGVGPAAPGSLQIATPPDRRTRDPDLPSIAVLPFADFSPGGDQGYFADGIAEEILNNLAGLPGLNVSGRTSSFAFREEEDVRTIGTRLGVGHVLQGSLRMEGRRIRIGAQLISVDDGFHLWNAEYDRELESVFDIEEEIAAEIVSALQVELGGRASDTAWATRTTPEAYREYLRGRQALNRLTTDGWVESLERFARAVELDSSFAAARAGVASAHFGQWFFGVRSLEASIRDARREARRALEQDDGVGDAHTVLGLIALYVDWDWAEAERQVVRALALNPNDALARHAYGDLLTILGDPEAGLRQIRLGAEADPLSVLAAGPAAVHLGFSGRFEEMIDAIGMLRERFPEQPHLADEFLAMGFWHLGRIDEAIAIYRTAWDRDPALSSVVETALAGDGPDGAMRAWADYLAATPAADREAGPVTIASLYARAGAADEAFEWLDRGFANPAPALLHAVAHPDFELLRDDPRFREFRKRLGIPEPG